MVLAWCALLWASPEARSQQPKPVAQKTGAAQPSKRLTLSFTGGAGIPISKAGIREFWNGSATGSVSILASVSREVAFGVGVDAGMLVFDQTKFIGTYPSVPVQERNTAFLHVYIAWRYTPFWKNRWAPFLGATVGAARFTAAEYKQMVNGVKVTYYEIPGMTRLSFGGILGTDLILSSRVALTVEGRMTYVHNDPEAGLWLALNGGIRFFL